MSYDDRSERRTQDPRDIVQIIQNFFEIEKEMIWEHHNDLFDDEIELEEIASVVIGRQIKGILNENKMLWDRVNRILSVKEKTRKNMAEAMV